MSRIWLAPSNVSKWQMGFNSVFKELKTFGFHITWRNGLLGAWVWTVQRSSTPRNESHSVKRLCLHLHVLLCNVSSTGPWIKQIKIFWLPYSILALLVPMIDAHFRRNLIMPILLLPTLRAIKTPVPGQFFFPFSHSSLARTVITRLTCHSSVSSPTRGLDRPRRFQEVKAPIFRDNDIGWW